MDPNKNKKRKNIQTVPYTDYVIVCNKIETYETETNCLRATIDAKEEIIRELKKSNTIFQDKINELVEECNNLKLEIFRLEQQIKFLKDELQQYKIKTDEKINKLENEIYQLKSRDDPITVREAFVALERYIMIEITGSKTQARSYYGLKDLFRDKHRQSNCEGFLLKYGITRDHINLIPDIKDVGNTSAHANRPSIERAVWDNFALSVILNTLVLDNNEKQIVCDLLKLLEVYNPVKPEMRGWIIQKPY